MGLTITLNGAQVADIQRRARTEYEKALAEKKDADKRYNDASGVYSKTGMLSTTRKYTLDELNAILGALPFEITVNIGENTEKTGFTDRRPSYRFASYAFRSSSGESAGHEVVVGTNGSSTSPIVTSCNCPAGKFGNSCWAQKAVARSVTRYYSPTSIPVVTKPTGHKVSLPSADFGLAK